METSVRGVGAGWGSSQRGSPSPVMLTRHTMSQSPAARQTDQIPSGASTRISGASPEGPRSDREASPWEAERGAAGPSHSP
jgi:hypothetical protein